MSFKKFNANTAYSSDKHAPVKGVPGTGNLVKHINDTKDVGVVVASNAERSLIRFGRQEQWYSNSELKIKV